MLRRLPYVNVAGVLTEPCLSFMHGNKIAFPNLVYVVFIRKKTNSLQTKTSGSNNTVLIALLLKIPPGLRVSISHRIHARNVEVDKTGCFIIIRISIHKTKAMAINKELLRCKLEIDGRTSNGI